MTLDDFPEAMQETMNRNKGLRGLGDNALASVIQVRKFMQMKQMISYMLGEQRWQDYDKYVLDFLMNYETIYLFYYLFVPGIGL
jgi:hypothetical protein